jgi:phage terminase large subunit-like protein
MMGSLPSPLLRRLLDASPEDRAELIAAMTAADLLSLDADFETWAHDGQLAPPGEGWRVWLMMAGRGFGKTRAGAEGVHRLAVGKPVRIALVAASIDEARSVMVEGASGVLSVARRCRVKVAWEPSKGLLSWPRGGQAQLYSGANADGLRGPEHGFAWCDELAKWSEADAAWTNLQMGLRAGSRPRALVTTTPKPMPLLTTLLQDKRTIVTGGRTKDNVNLPSAFVEAMIELYGGTRTGAQELDGKLMAEAEGSLWPRSLIERSRVAPPVDAMNHAGLGMFDRIVVGVDPPAGAGEGCDACGIVVVGRSDGKLYVLADESVGGLSPEGWANRVAVAAAWWNTSQVVAEANNGGAMVESVLKAADTGLHVRLVHASKGKVARAEPVALRFERGKAFLAGHFPALEGELGGLVAGGGYEGPGRSPDRADAMVWAMTVLAETRSGLPRVTRL